MKPADQKRLEDIADGLMDSFPVFFKRVTRGAAQPSSRKFDPSMVVLKMALMHGPLPMSMIGGHMGISKPYMTALVDELIDKGLVERVPDPEDRRVINVRITEAGKAEIKEFMKGARQAIIKNLSSLDAEDISSLHEMVRNVRDIISKLDEDKARERSVKKDV